MTTNTINYCENTLTPAINYEKARGYRTTIINVPNGYNQDEVAKWLNERYEVHFLGGTAYQVVIK